MVLCSKSQVPVEPGDACQVGFGHRKVVCPKTVYQIWHKNNYYVKFQVSSFHTVGVLLLTKKEYEK